MAVTVAVKVEMVPAEHPEQVQQEAVVVIDHLGPLGAAGEALAA